ncbi:hypothetical protein HII36_29890 [Nonomuraea sp. NN258]|uniref:hypothetical protein n=1 Tax=Nonomuraea antri TaxID=2730852 RepID=UPI001568ED94|nr:hypothetical protein [Nonomuraea antri]NRQ36013.1 hypothetical protein [Nonomuraea antri]
MTRPSRALTTLHLAAHFLTTGSVGTAWRVTTDQLGPTAQRAGRLERLTLWKLLLDVPGPNTDLGTNEYDKDTEIAILAALNAIDPEPGAAWHSRGLTTDDSIPPDQQAPGKVVLAYAAFWKLTDTAASSFGTEPR